MCGSGRTGNRRGLRAGSWRNRVRSRVAVGPPDPVPEDRLVLGHRRPQEAERGTPMPGSIRVGPDAEGATSKSKIAVGM